MSNVPELESDTALGHLILRGPGQTEQHLTHLALRQACPCAFCRAALMRGQVATINPDIRLISIHTMGYGVQLGFDDGHDRGIFPWSYLAELTRANQADREYQAAPAIGLR